MTNEITFRIYRPWEFNIIATVNVITYFKKHCGYSISTSLISTVSSRAQ